MKQNNNNNMIHKEQEIIEDLQRQNEILKQEIKAYENNQQIFKDLVEIAVGKIGQDFLNAIAQKISEWLNIECVIIGKKVDNQSVRATPMYLDGEIITNYSYKLEGSPCDLAMAKSFCVYTENVAELFPKDLDLKAMGAVGYIGIALNNKLGEASGVLCAISRNKLKLPPHTESIMKMIGERITQEIERNKAESEIRKLSTAVTQSPAAIEITDINGTIEYINPQFTKISGYLPEDVIGKHSRIIKSSYHTNDYYKELWDTILAGKVWKGELYNKHKNGSCFWEEATIAPIFGANNEITNFISVNQDITKRKAAERALKESEAELKKAQQTSKTGSWKWYIKEGTLWWSDEMYRIFDIDKDTFTGKLGDVIKKAIHPDDKDRVEQLNRLVITDNKPIPAEYRIIRNDGSIGYVYGLADGTVSDETGKITILTGIIKDITDYKLIQNALTESKEMLTEAQQIAKTGSWTVNVGTNKAHWSDEIYRIFDCEPSDFEANTEAFLAFVHPDDKDLVISSYQKSEETKELLSVNHRLITKKGALKYVKQKHRTIFDTKGQPIKAVGILIDRTESRQTNAEIKKLSIAVEQNPTTIIITDTNGRIEYANPRLTELTQYTVQEAIGKTPRIFKSGKTDKATIKDLWNTIKAGKTWKGELINVKKNGEVFIEAATIAPIFDENNEIANFIAIKEDITMRKQAEEALKERELQLEELNATKDKFFSIISHDLKNPFNILLGFSELLAKSGSKYSPEQVQTFAQSMRNSAKQAYALLVNLLEWSRIQTGKLTPNPEKLKVSDIIYEVTLLCDTIANAKDIQLISENIVDDYIFADKEMMKTILRNLITNAIKFTHKEGIVRVETKKDNEKVIFIVEDSGIGIDPMHIEKLFRIDSKLSRNGTADESGTGLGLILCKEFVKQNNGEIWVESEVDKGSVFKFFIPIMPSEIPDNQTAIPKNN